MTKEQKLLTVIAAAAGLWYYSQRPSPPPAPPAPTPVQPTKPKGPLRKPCPGPGPCPSVDALSTGGPVGPGGVEVQIDFPAGLRTRNVGGRDGAGLCVFSSIGHAARWQNDGRLKDFQTLMRKEPGGGYPEKVDTMIAKYAPGTQYVQYEGGDLSVLRAALNGGRMPSVTYDGRDPHYGSQRIAHMVNLVHLDDQAACVLDNNFVGDDDLVWMTPEEFRARWTGGRSGWAVFLLSPPPPPPPSPTRRFAGLPVDSPVFSPTERYTWLAGEGEQYLYHDGHQVGGYREGEWRDRLSPGIWGEPVSAPPLPVGASPLDYGVQLWRLHGDRERWSRNGRQTTRGAGMQSVSIPNDSALPHLTVIGPTAERSRVLADLETSPELSAYRGRYRVQGYEPGEWVVKDCGFVTGGRPTIYVQSPDGSVLHRQDVYDGPGPLAEALRKANPDYRPASDVDLRGLFGVPWVWVAVGVGLYLFLKGK